jgi:hypothetical protein
MTLTLHLALLLLAFLLAGAAAFGVSLGWLAVACLALALIF